MRNAALLAGVIAISTVCQARLPEPEPDFNLQDVNDESPRYTNAVSPRDYLLQVPAFYFASATCSYCRNQFAHLDSLQAELRELNPEINIEIIGINNLASDSDFSNSIFSSGREIPWLQDTSDVRAWDLWGVEWRDVRILDTQNRLYAVMNLTENDLGIPANREHLKTLLLEAATLVDTDDDGLPDPWEQQNLDGITEAATDDADGDGFDNATEFAFGSDPADALSFPVLERSFDSTGRLQVTFRRWVGATLNFTVETSTDLNAWSADGAYINILGNPRNLFDGSGRSAVTYILSQDTNTAPVSFVRARAVPAP